MVVSGPADDTGRSPSQSPTMTAPDGGSPGGGQSGRASAPPAPSAIESRFPAGTVLAGRYRIVSSLGRGGMGEVYRADDLKLDQPVALKFLPEALEADAARISRLIEEVKIARQIAHPNVCRVYDVGEADGHQFIAMEYIEGEDLGALLRQIGRCPRDRAVEIGAEICRGLQAAHDQGVLHRDLKPANLMIDASGRVRITDFGLARVTESLTGSEARSGTPAYMAPEQLAGREVTAKSDLYALGLVLYELFTGRPAFMAGSAAELSRQQQDTTPELPSRLVDGLDPELDRVILRCLELDPAARPANAREVAAELGQRTTRDEQVALAAPAAAKRRWPLAAAAALALAIVAGAVLLGSLRDQPPDVEVPAGIAARPAVAVLFFENLSGDPELEWLRTGLAELMVAGLSRSADIDVVSTDRIYEILEDLDALEARFTSSELVRQVAERAGVDKVLLGSIARAGDTLRINVNLQEVTTGKIVGTDRADGVGEESLFSMVDDLTLGVRQRFELPRESEGVRKVDITEVTTTSAEAFRYYSEGRRLGFQGKEEEKVALVERAVEIDPSFAEALSSLAVSSANLGRIQEADDYGRRAFEQRERAIPRSQTFIEAWYYSRSRDTHDRSIQAYRQLLAIDPDNRGAPNNLANLLADLGRYEEAADLLQESAGRGIAGGYGHVNLATYYAVLGELDKAYEVLQEPLQKEPDSFVFHRYHGSALVTGGKLDEAEEALRRADSLRPGDFNTLSRFWYVAALREQWLEATEFAQRLEDSASQPSTILGQYLQAVTSLYSGRSSEALAILERAIQGYARPDGIRSGVHSFVARLLIERGETRDALAALEAALQEGRGKGAEDQARFLTALAHLRSGELEEARRRIDSFGRRAEELASGHLARQYRHLLGELALASGDLAGAASELEQADALLPPRGFPWIGYDRMHLPVWYSLAAAYLASGDDDLAADSLRRITESGVEHAGAPIPYVRSFYLLGTIHEKRGEMDAAREHYERFLGYWEEGDLDREWVVAAKSKH